MVKINDAPWYYEMAEFDETEVDSEKRTMPKFEVGDLVWYRGRWGHDPPVAATITDCSEKEGKALFNCQRENAQDWGSAWGYEYQFTSRACHLCGAATDTPGCPLCPDCAREQEEQE